ncbi:PE-PPE domain-containing protein [Mycobacterium sp. NPDC051804]|uniref:PE-PPE domain-containing protein n=1 Tax=Mycobacterium sp. NPDC051804 TaxID=3364295 RepID=UPI0037B2EB0F
MTALLAAVSLAATTALIVPGTGTPNANDVGDYMENFRDYYMRDSSCTVANSCELEGVNYYASFWPLPLPGWCDPGRCEKFDVSVADGVDNLEEELQALKDAGYTGDVVIAGYSQGGRVASIAKTKIASGEWADLISELEDIEFVFIGNPNRPNGGILSRFGILGTIPIIDVTTGQPTPTDTGFKTEDWAIRWEGIADFPQYLLNPLAVANSLLGFYYDHGTYLAINEDSDPDETPAGYSIAEWKELTKNPHLYPRNVQIQHVPGSDTTYYTVTPKVLPLVRPLHSIPFLGKPIADLIEPALRVIIEETGYNRNIPFGQATPIELFPLFDPVTLIVKLIPAIFQGINNFFANFGLATEIPLTPPIPVPVVSTLGDEEGDDLEQFSMLSDFDDASKSRLSLVQDNIEQQPDGDEKNAFLSLDNGLDGAGLQQDPGGSVDGLVDPIQGDPIQGDPIQGDPIQGDPIEGDPIQGDPNQGDPIEGDPIQGDPNQGDPIEGDPNQGDPNQGTQIGTKDPEENNDAGGNRVDANGGGVSLNFSPNKPGEGATVGGDTAGQVDPDEVEGPEEGAEGAENAAGSEPAAA